MTLGFVSAIFEQATFEEVIDAAAEMGYGCVELACWPGGESERRYAGVCHLDMNTLDDARIQYVKDYCQKKGVFLSALAYYPNVLDADENKANAAIEHLKKVIVASRRLGIGMTTTFIGRNQYKTVEENLELVKRVWPPLLKLAEENDVKIGIENCPMLFTTDQWPGGQNLFTSPALWRRIFQILPSKNLGINYDPSHFIWQMMDYIGPLYEFADRIFHVHCKDIKLFEDKLADVGTMACPLEYMAPKLPGLGDVDWSAYISAINDIRYDGPICVEMEDRAFESSPARMKDSLVLSKRYLEQFLI